MHSGRGEQANSGEGERASLGVQKRADFNVYKRIILTQVWRERATLGVND